jgi:hypothetical protein
MHAGMNLSRVGGGGGFVLILCDHRHLTAKPSSPGYYQWAGLAAVYEEGFGDLDETSCEEVCVVAVAGAVSSPIEGLAFVLEDPEDRIRFRRRVNR